MAYSPPGALTSPPSNTTDTLKFPNGTIRLRHSPGTGPQSFNRHTCLITVHQHGTYTLLTGPGKYPGITGHGRCRLDILAVGARSHGQDVQLVPPVAAEPGELAGPAKQRVGAVLVNG